MTKEGKQIWLIYLPCSVFRFQKNHDELFLTFLPSASSHQPLSRSRSSAVLLLIPVLGLRAAAKTAAEAEAYIIEMAMANTNDAAKAELVKLINAAIYSIGVTVTE